MENHLIRWPDLVVIVLYFLSFVGIGAYFARKQKSTESYFLAGRNMPGWVVGFSLMATIISSMTFLAFPGFAFENNWRYMPTFAGYLVAVVVIYYLFMPFFRRSSITTAYEYLERRFGLWARLYAAAGFVLFQIFRMSVILYAVSLAIGTLFDVPMTWIIVIAGILVASYTIAGGLEAVIWTDLIQGIALIGGGLICLPIVVFGLPGGLGQLFSEAYADGKLSMGSSAFVFNEKTLWVMAIMSLFIYLQIGCAEQMSVQRYCAPRTDREARKAIILGAALTVPVWMYFTFIGTALYVFYKTFPDPGIAEVVQQPEQILPYFILTKVPAGLAGFVISGLLAAAMSTIDSSINASAATVTTDFYRRLIAPDCDERRSLTMGRWLSAIFGVLMITGALAIHYTRTQTLADYQALFQSVMSGGIAGLFLLGFLTRRVGTLCAIVAVVTTLLGILAWIFLDSETGYRLFPALEGHMPDKFWMIVLANIYLFASGFGMSMLVKSKATRDLENLTIWTAGDKNR